MWTEFLFRVVYLAYRVPWWGWLLLLVAFAEAHIVLNPGCCSPGMYGDFG